MAQHSTAQHSRAGWEAMAECDSQKHERLGTREQ